MERKIERKKEGKGEAYYKNEEKKKNIKRRKRTTKVNSATLGKERKIGIRIERRKEWEKIRKENQRIRNTKVKRNYFYKYESKK